MTKPTQLFRLPKVGEIIQFDQEVLGSFAPNSRFHSFSDHELKVTELKKDWNVNGHEVHFTDCLTGRSDQILLLPSGLVAGATTPEAKQLPLFYLRKGLVAFCECPVPKLITNSCLGKIFQVCKNCGKEYLTDNKKGDDND
jgi:hypothetical protein